MDKLENTFASKCVCVYNKKRQVFYLFAFDLSNRLTYTLTVGDCFWLAPPSVVIREWRGLFSSIISVELLVSFSIQSMSTWDEISFFVAVVFFIVITTQQAAEPAFAPSGKKGKAISIFRSLYNSCLSSWVLKLFSMYLFVWQKKSKRKKKKGVSDLVCEPTQGKFN